MRERRIKNEAISFVFVTVSNELNYGIPVAHLCSCVASVADRNVNTSLFAASISQTRSIREDANMSLDFIETIEFTKGTGAVCQKK